MKSYLRVEEGREKSSSRECTQRNKLNQLDSEEYPQPRYHASIQSYCGVMAGKSSEDILVSTIASIDMWSLCGNCVGSHLRHNLCRSECFSELCDEAHPPAPSTPCISAQQHNEMYLCSSEHINWIEYRLFRCHIGNRCQYHSCMPIRSSQ